MSGKACRQTYLGRVTYPAKYFANEKSGKPFISFVVYVDGVAIAQDKTKMVAKIPCTYSVSGEKDPVAFSLININTGKEDDDNGLAGYKYKSVDVMVEGSEKLTQVMGNDGPIAGAVYKNLEYCQVSILDKQVLQAYKKLMDGENTPPAEAAKPATQTPTQAPSAKNTKKATPPPVEQEQVETSEESSELKPGDKFTYEGKDYEYVAGDPTDINSYKLVQKAPPFAKKAAAKATPAPKKSSVMGMLQDSETMSSESPFTDEDAAV